MEQPRENEESYTEYVKRYHEQQAEEARWAETLRKGITPLEDPDIDPYGIGGLETDQIEELAIWEKRRR